MALFSSFKTLIDESIKGRKKKMRAGNIYQFKKFSKFKTVAEFNKQKERFLQQHPDLFTQSEFIAFEVLTQFSVVVPGVANAKIATLVSACSGKQGGVSRATFVRMLRKAKTTGFLKVHKTYRASGGFAHNVFVFQLIDVSPETQLTYRGDAEVPSPGKDEDTNFAPETKNLFSNLQNKDLNIRQEKNVTLPLTPNNSSFQDLDYTFVPDTVPQHFIHTVKPFFDQATEIYNFWEKALMAYRQFDLYQPLEQMTALVINAFKTTIFQYKHRKIKTSFMQYYYGTLTTMLSAEKRREHTSNATAPRYNWLDA
jgi:hypothetical protein